MFEKLLFIFFYLIFTSCQENAVIKGSLKEEQKSQ